MNSVAAVALAKALRNKGLINNAMERNQPQSNILPKRESLRAPGRLRIDILVRMVTASK